MRTGLRRKRAGRGRRGLVAAVLATAMLTAACGPFGRNDDAAAEALAAAAADDPCALITRQEASDYTNADMGPGHINTSYIPPFIIPGARICTFEGFQREGSMRAGRPTFLHIALTPPGVSADYALELLPDASEVEERGGELEDLEQLPLNGTETVEVSEVATKVVASGNVVQVVVDNRLLSIRFEPFTNDEEELEDLRGDERVRRLAALILSRDLAPVGLTDDLTDDDDAVPPDGPTPATTTPAPEEQATPSGTPTPATGTPTRADDEGTTTRGDAGE